MASQKPSNGWSTIYKFNAKPLDAETDLYYYGARYGVYPDQRVRNPRISLWYSLSCFGGRRCPMSSDYQDLSICVCIANNPLEGIVPKVFKIATLYNNFKQYAGFDLQLKDNILIDSTRRFENHMA